jgi:hypothetical protein
VRRVESDVPESRRVEATRRIDAYLRHLHEVRRREVPPSRPLEVLAAHVAALRQTIAETTET